MSLVSEFLLKLEKWLPLALAVLFAIGWYFFGSSLAGYIRVNPSNLYPTLITIASIALSLLCIVKTIIISASDSKGINLLKTNSNMWLRFIRYITRSMLTQGFLIMLVLGFLITEKTLDQEIISYLFILTFTYAITSFIRVQICFSAMLQIPS